MELLTEIQLSNTDPKAAGHQIRAALSQAKVVWAKPQGGIQDLRSFYDGVVENVGAPIEIGEDFRNQGEKTNERWLETVSYTHLTLPTKA